MSIKKIILGAAILLIYILIWGPVVYSAVDMYADMLFGSYIKNSQLALYWSYAFSIVLFVILVILPPIVIFAFVMSKEPKEAK